MESIITPLLKLFHNIPEDLYLTLLGIILLLFYKYVFNPWNKNILNISQILHELNNIEKTNTSIKDEIILNLEKIDNCLKNIKDELEDLVEIKKQLEKQSNSTNKIEIDFIKRFYEIENKLIKITTQLEPVLVSLKGIK
jgi:hypothetical protein